MAALFRLMPAALSFILLGSIASCTPWDKGGAPKPKGYVLVIVDTLRADFLGAYGAPDDISPHVDQIAAEGARFANAVAPAPWTLPSISSILTSRYPSEHGEGVQPGAAIAPPPPTLAELLHAAGYRTAAFVDSAWPLLRRGFDTVEMPTGGQPARLADPERNSAAVTFSGAIEWLRSAGDRPFFLLIHTCEVHDYFFAKSAQREFASQHDPTYEGAFRSWGVRDPMDDGTEIMSGILAANAADIAYVRQLYAAAVHTVDREIARLDATLGELGIRDDTILVLTSDHGEGFRPDLHRVHHGGRLHDDLLRVPLVMRWPGHLPRTVVDERVELLDVMPTLLQLASVTVPEGARGHSLLVRSRGFDFWNSGRLRVRVDQQPALAEESIFYVRPSGMRERSSIRQAALYAGDLKLIRSGDRRELYNVQRDPDETHNLAGERGADVARLDGQIVRLLPHLGGAGVEPRPEVMEHLRSLGYAQ